jgi:hypothetical protein
MAILIYTEGCCTLLDGYHRPLITYHDVFYMFSLNTGFSKNREISQNKNSSFDPGEIKRTLGQKSKHLGVKTQKGVPDPRNVF